MTLVAMSACQSFQSVSVASDIDNVFPRMLIRLSGPSTSIEPAASTMFHPNTPVKVASETLFWLLVMRSWLAVLTVTGRLERKKGVLVGMAPGMMVLVMV